MRSFCVHVLFCYFYRHCVYFKLYALFMYVYPVFVFLVIDFVANWGIPRR